MLKLIDLKLDSILVSLQIVSKLDPDYICIPLEANTIINVKNKDKVAIGQKLTDQDIYAPISGKVENLELVDTYLKKMYALKIRNDFKETNINTQKKINSQKITKKDLQETLSNFNFAFDKPNLIINAIDDEYQYTQSFYLLDNYENILDLLERMATLLKIKIILALRENNQENINNLLTYRGMYPSIQIKIVPNLYLLGNDYCLQNFLQIEEANVLKVSQIYELDSYLKTKRESRDLYITISGNNVLNPCVINTYKGVSLNYLLENIKLVNQESDIYINSLLQGKKVNKDNFIITGDVKSILIQKKESLKKEERCLNCGACLNICPVNINPLLFKDQKYLAKVKDKCLKCGLCSYICPAYINFNKYLEEEEIDAL